MYKRQLQLLSYEDSLYSEEHQNWLDYREKGKPRVMNAWCHGAPGVLLSRMELARYMDSEQIQRDIRRSAKALFMQEPGDHICLCHGIAGHLRIMKKYLSEYAEDMPEDFEKQAYQSRYEQLLAELLLHLEGYGKQVAHEYYNCLLYTSYHLKRILLTMDMELQVLKVLWISTAARQTLFMTKICFKQELIL